MRPSSHVGGDQQVTAGLRTQVPAHHQDTTAQFTTSILILPLGRFSASYHQHLMRRWGWGKFKIPQPTSLFHASSGPCRETTRNLHYYHHCCWVIAGLSVGILLRCWFSKKQSLPASFFTGLDIQFCIRNLGQLMKHFIRLRFVCLCGAYH